MCTMCRILWNWTDKEAGPEQEKGRSGTAVNRPRFASGLKNRFREGTINTL